MKTNEAQANQILKLLALMTTSEMCLGADAVSEAHAWANEGKAWKLRDFQATSPRSWLKMYKSTRRLVAVLESPFAAFQWPRAGERSPALKLWSFLNWASTPGGKLELESNPRLRGHPVRRRRGRAHFQRFLISQVEAYVHARRNPKAALLAARAEDEAPFEPDTAQVPALLFLCFVITRCWIDRGRMPSQLLRKARGGDIDALEYLLSIDPRVQRDPKIQTQIEDARFNSPARTARITRAMQHMPKTSPKSVRVALAGMAKTAFGPIGVNEPTVRGLFDSASRFNSRGAQRIDTDLPNSPESFAKAMNRWQKDHGSIIAKVHGQKPK